MNPRPTNMLLTAILLLPLACDDEPSKAQQVLAERAAEREAKAQADEEKAAESSKQQAAAKAAANETFTAVRTQLRERFKTWNDALESADAPECAKVDAAKAGAAGKAFSLDRALLRRTAEDMLVPAVVTGEEGSPDYGYTSGALWAALASPMSDEAIDKLHSSQRSTQRDNKREAMEAAPAIEGIVHGIVLDPTGFQLPQVVGERKFKPGRLVADAYLFREDALVCRMHIDTRGADEVGVLTFDGVSQGAEGRLANDLQRSGRNEAAQALIELGLITEIDPALWPPQP